MSPEDWRIIYTQTGIAGLGFVAFVWALRRGWIVMGSEHRYVKDIADRFMTIADRSLERLEALNQKHHDENGSNK